MGRIGSARFWGADVILRGGVLGGLAMLVACSIALESEKVQCARDADCLHHGLDAPICQQGVCRASSSLALDGSSVTNADPQWGCVGHTTEVLVEPTVPVVIPMAFHNLVSGAMRTGLHVVACESDDRDCAHPVEGSSSTVDDEGNVDIPVYSGFKGFFKISAGGNSPSLMDSYIPVLPVPDKNVTVERRHWSLFSKDEFAATVALLTGGARTFNPDFGTLFFVTVDCQVAPAAGQVATLTPTAAGTFRFYTDGASSPNLTQEQTSIDGAGGYVNVPPGDVSVRVTRVVDATYRVEHVSEHSLFVKAASLTLVIVPPQ